MPDLQTLLNKFLANLYGGFGTGVNYLPSGMLAINLTAGSNGTTLETDLISSTVTGIMAVNAQGVRIRAWGTTAANANSKVIRLYFGATLVGAVAAFTTSASGWVVQADVYRTGATAQVAIGFGNYVSSGYNNITNSTPAETLSGAIVIKVTGQAAAGASNDITGVGLTVEALP